MRRAGRNMPHRYGIGKPPLSPPPLRLPCRAVRPKRQCPKAAERFGEQMPPLFLLQEMTSGIKWHHGTDIPRPACGTSARKACTAVSPQLSRHESIFSLKRIAFQTIRPGVSRKKRVFFAWFRPGGAVPPPRVLPFSKAKCSIMPKQHVYLFNISICYYFFTCLPFCHARNALQLRHQAQDSLADDSS